MADKKYKCKICKRYRSAKQFGSIKQKSGKVDRLKRCNSCRSSLTSYRRFGVDEEWYTNQLTKQNGRCAICGEKEKSKSVTGEARRRLSIDHCHSTNKARGLLCNSCNNLLGRAKDSVTIMLNAIRYIENGGY